MKHPNKKSEAARYENAYLRIIIKQRKNNKILEVCKKLVKKT
jgi:hypothetical protein